MKWCRLNHLSTPLLLPGPQHPQPVRIMGVFLVYKGSLGNQTTIFHMHWAWLEWLITAWTLSDPRGHCHPSRPPSCLTAVLLLLSLGLHIGFLGISQLQISLVRMGLVLRSVSCVREPGEPRGFQKFLLLLLWSPS